MEINPPGAPGVRILIVDDERPIRRFLRSALSGQYAIFEAESGADALQVMTIIRPDVVLLDLGLPDINGVEVTRRLREWTLVPVIVISVQDREEDKVSALDAGADDYLTKPFSVHELTARIRAALRHCAKPEMESVYRHGDLEVNLSRREVHSRDQLVALTPTEYEILRALVAHAGKVLTHKQLIHAVWGGSEDADSHLLRVNVSNLRKKLEHDPLFPRHIITEPGVGYRLRDVEP